MSHCHIDEQLSNRWAAVKKVCSCEAFKKLSVGEKLSNRQAAVKQESSCFTDEQLSNM